MINAAPLIRRQLRISSRRPSTYYSRTLIVGSCVLLVLVELLLNKESMISASQLSRLAFLSVGVLAAFYAVLLGSVSTADLISSEKRGETLGLLLLTRLSPTDVVLARIFPSLLGFGGHILALLPVPALTLMLGGVEPMDVALLLAGCLNLLLFGASAGIFSSALTREAPRAIVLALILALTPLAIWLFGSFLDPLPAFDRLTGLVGAWLVGVTNFFLLHACILAGSLIFMILASLWIRFGVKGFPFQINLKKRFGNPGEMDHMLEVKLRALPAWFEDSNPLLRAFFHRNNRWIGGLAAGMGGLAAILPILAKTKDEFLAMVFASTVVVGIGFLCFKFLLGLRAQREFSEDFKTGAIELLLSTPADPDAIVRGKLLLLKREMVRPFLYLSLPLGMALLGNPFFNPGAGPMPLFTGFSAGAFGCLIFILYQALECHSVAWIGASNAVGPADPGRRGFAVASTVLWHVCSQCVSSGLVCLVLNGDLPLQSLSCLGLLLLFPPALLFSARSRLIGERVLVDNMREFASAEAWGDCAITIGKPVPNTGQPAPG